MIMSDVTIIDYGSGNMLSVKRGFEYFGIMVEISSDPAKVKNAKKIVLPGVGAFPSAMQALYDRNLIKSIFDAANSNVPILGICLGMQLLMDKSTEFGDTNGLGLISGTVEKVIGNSGDGGTLKVPHIGWTPILKLGKKTNWEESILRNIRVGQSAYFAHSYVAKLKNKSDCLAISEYGDQGFPSVIRNRNITGCQFHPEKSGQVGLNILKAFCDK